MPSIDFLDALLDESSLQNMDNALITVKAVADGMDYKLNQKRVNIYTTWGVDDGSAMAEVPLVNTSGQ